MPFTLLAHQVPVLPLKLWRPRWFDGVALVFGSIAPDLEYIFRGHLRPIDGHSLEGQLTFCLPLTLILATVFRQIVALPLALHLPDGGAFHLRDYRLLADSGPRSPWGWLRTSLCALLGSGSHIFLDSFTHWNGYMVLRLPFLSATVMELGGEPVPLFRAFQFGGSVVGMGVALAMIYFIGRGRFLLRWSRVDGLSTAPPPVAATPSSHVVLWTSAGIAVSIAAVLRVFFGGPMPTHPAMFTLAGFLVLQVASVGFVGLCLGCTLAWPRMARVSSKSG